MSQAFLIDLRAAARSLLASRGFTTIAVATLGMGLALCMTVLAVLNAYLVRALPYPAADRLYRLDYAAPGQDRPQNLERLEWRALDDAIEHPIAWDLDVFYMLSGARGEHTQRVAGAWVTPGYIHGFGIRATRGRLFEERDFRAGEPQVALISHTLWQTRYLADPAIVGRTFQAYVSDRPDEAETFTIVGVLPRDLWHINTYSEVLAPLRASSYPYMARLRPGVSRETAADRLTAFVRAGAAAVPEGWRAIVTPLRDSYVASVRPMLLAVAAGAVLVLLIAGANVAVLMLVRGRRRQKDVAIRLAMGASPARVVRLLAFEGLLIGLSATVLGLGISHLAVSALGPLVEGFLDRRVPGGVDAVAIDGTVVGLAVASGLILTSIFSLVSLLATRAPRWAIGLSSARGATDSRAARRARSVLIAVEVAASLTLLAGAALMVASALRMLRVDFGIDAGGVATAGVGLRQRSYPDAASQTRYYERLLAQLAGVGGSPSFALGNWWPLQTITPRRVAADGAARQADASVFAVTGGYFATLGMALRDGRDFTARDAAGDPVVIVSESLARRLWPGARAVGQQLAFPSDDGARREIRRVVGVVNDVRQSHRDDSQLDAYVPFLEQAGRFAFIYLRTPATPSWESDLRAAVAAVDPEVALATPQWLQAGLEQERQRPRFLALLLTVFAVVACGMALVGMYGVIAYAVRQRQREVAIRMAVGANARAVMWLFLRQGGLVLLGGLGAGVAGAMGLGRVLQSYLHGVAPSEPGLLAAATLAFAVSGLVAVWWPARRAALTDAAIVLKEEG